MENQKTLLPVPTWIDCFYTVKVGELIAICPRRAAIEKGKSCLSSLTLLTQEANACSPAWRVCLDTEGQEPGRVLLRITKAIRKVHGYACKVEPAPEGEEGWECPRGDCSQINPPEQEYCQGEKCLAFRAWAEANQQDAEEDR